MRPDLLSTIQAAGTKGWKKVEIEFTGGPLVVSLPRECVSLAMKKAKVLRDPSRAVVQALEEPCAGPGLEEILRRKEKSAQELSVAITVSDITRPVPYKGKDGLLPPLLRKLKNLGVRQGKIRILVGTGTHRASTAEEKVEMLGAEVVCGYEIYDHDCQDASCLVCVGQTPAGTEVFLNRLFHEADVKIATGLTESHFMAGASGGRKAVCPGLVDLRTIQKFHSPAFLESPCATNLVFEGNPCHEEAMAVAQSAAVDFTVTVTLDKDMRLTGVFAGSLKEVLQRAVERIRDYVEIPIEKEFDLVLTHGGYAGRNHYQAAKAAVGALPAVKAGGTILIAADNRDAEPIGGPEYKTLIHLLKLQGPEGYVDMLRSPGWKFTRDQWEPEMWGRVLRKVGEEGLVYCTADISAETSALLPGISGYEFLTARGRRKSRPRKVQEMVQNAVIYTWQKARARDARARMAFIREGPYAVPLPIKD